MKTQKSSIESIFDNIVEARRFAQYALAYSGYVEYELKTDLENLVTNATDIMNKIHNNYYKNLNKPNERE